MGPRYPPKGAKFSSTKPLYPNVTLFTELELGIGLRQVQESTATQRKAHAYTIYMKHNWDSHPSR